MSAFYGIAAYLLTVLMSDIFMRLFTSDPAVIETGSHILVIVNIALLFTGIQNMQTTYFQAAGKKIMSLVLALCGQLLCFVPAVFVLSRLYGLEGVWYAFPVSAVAALIISSVLSKISF